MPQETAMVARKSKNLTLWLIVGGIALVITLLTRSLGTILALAGVILFFVAIYGIVRGSAKLFRIRSRGVAFGALGIALVLILIGGGTNAAMGISGSNESGGAPTTSEPKPFAASESAKPSPKPTSFEEVQESQAVPFEKVVVDDANIDVGQTAITTPGADGTKVLTYRVTYVDGQETARELVGEAVTVEPVTEVTSNGTRQPAPAPVPFVEAPSGCHSSYTGVCVPITSDVDCDGGSGDGPGYVRGPLQVVGNDEYDLDRDGDGIACD